MPLQSPVKATAQSTPNDGSNCKVFYHHTSPNTQKTHGYTPNKTRRVRLSDHEGSNHNKITTPGETIYTDHNEFYTVNTFDAKYKTLLLALKNLKERLDNDFKMKPKYKNYAHYHASYLLIQQCICMLQEMVNLPEDLKDYDFLSHLNAAISEEYFDEKLYNPIDMLPCYAATGHRAHESYDKKQATTASERRTPLTDASILAMAVDTQMLKKRSIPLQGIPVIPTPSKYCMSKTSSLSSLLTDSESIPESDLKTTSTSSSPTPYISQSLFVNVESSLSTLTPGSSGSISSGFKSFCFNPPSSSKTKKRKTCPVFSQDSDDDTTEASASNSPK